MEQIFIVTLNGYLAQYPRNIQKYLDDSRCAKEIEMSYPTSKPCLPKETKAVPVAEELTAPVEEVTETN